MLLQRICFLMVVRSFRHVQSSIQDEEYCCLIQEFPQGVELVPKRDGGRLVRFKLPEGRKTRELSYACGVQKTICLLLVVSLSRCIGVIFELTQVHFSFLTECKLNETRKPLHKEESLLFVNRMLMAPFVTACVSDNVTSYRC